MLLAPPRSSSPPPSLSGVNRSRGDRAAGPLLTKHERAALRIDTAAMHLGDRYNKDPFRMKFQVESVRDRRRMRRR